VRVGNYVKLVAFIVVIAVAAASGAPQDRSTIARVAVFALIVTAAVGLMDLARRRSPLPEASVFEPQAERASAPSLPADLERLGVEVRAFSAPLEAGATQVPGALRRACRVIAAGRLARHGDLRLDEPADAAACAEACGPDLWAALDGQPTAMDPDALARALERL
jgi:hypothetical protein